MKTQLFSHCPSCTSNKVQIQNNHKFSCLACGFNYFHNTAAAVIVLLKKDDLILFTVRNTAPAKGKLDFPGGFVALKERARMAAVREIKEELNLDLIEEKLEFIAGLPNTYPYKGIVYNTMDLAFVYQGDFSSKFDLSSEEIAEVKWLDPKKIKKKEVAFDSTFDLIKNYLT